MNLHFPSLLPLLLTLYKPCVKTSSQPIFTFLLLIFLPNFSKTSPKKNFNINMLSLPLLNKHSFKRKPFLIFLIFKNSALLKITLAHYGIFFSNPPLPISIFPKPQFKYSNKRTNSNLFTHSPKSF